MQWKPIETAPKDGQWIQVWREPEKRIGIHAPLVFARWSITEDAWVWPDETYDPFTVRGRFRADDEIEEDNFFASNEFTHWMPLPTQPVE